MSCKLSCFSKTHDLMEMSAADLIGIEPSTIV